MRFLSDIHFEGVDNNWKQLIEVIHETALILESKKFSQPLKPYLRFNNVKNRIIAMPAFIGGGINVAGIKWIASFPDNIKQNIRRAHSTTILNNADTGEPFAIINSPIISGLRTAAVSGAIIKGWLKRKSCINKSLTVGIAGFGPIGQLHIKMLYELFGNVIDKFLLYDIKPINVNTIPPEVLKNSIVCDNWQDAYINSDIFCTCTTSEERYIDIQPPKGSLQINVSLRDYKTEIKKFLDIIIVDDWDEVCRENTDIEQMHQKEGLIKKDTIDIVTFLCTNEVAELNNEVVMFNPMGMAVFDISIAKHYFDRSKKEDFGIEL